MACVFRLVATDLDGTLLHSDGTVTERSRDVIRAVEVGRDQPEHAGHYARPPVAARD